MQKETFAPIRWVDLIRVLGSLLVVMAHLNYTISRGTLPYEFYYGLSRIAVPLFFLVSGFLLLSKQEPLGDFFKKRAWKILLPFIVWSLIYMAIGGDFSKVDSIRDTIISTIVKILRGPRAAHFWFLYALIGLYLATPILRLFISKAKDSDLIYFILVWLAAVPMYGILEDYTRVRIGFEWNMFTGYIGYFVLGYFLGKKEYSARELWSVAGLFIVSFIITWLGIYVSRKFDPYIDYIETYLSLNVVIMSTTGFVLLSSVKINDSWYRFLLPQSKASFGVYIIHILILGQMMALPPFNNWFSNPSAIWVMPVLSLFGYIFSFAVVFILQKIPIIRQLVP